ncbi:hypothetical protein ACFW5S_32910 [Streptomyces olivaceus]|uniref:hypothetical protein n=1 Tax=Streptomyces olivaceus TaxID=47716 RepID=UPI0033BA75D1
MYRPAASRRRTVATIAAVLLTFTAVAACDELDRAVDCVQTADSLAVSVAKLEKALSSTEDGDATRAQQAMDDLDTELAELREKTEDSELDEAVDELTVTLRPVREAVTKGDSSPNLRPASEAAAEVVKVCTP